MKTKKSLGQHFLTSNKIVEDIVRVGGVNKDDTVLEIGPGQGILTQKLLETGAHIISIEKDDRLIPELETKFAKEISQKQLDLIHADVLNLNIDTLIEGKYKIIANIPYYITGQIIRMFLEAPNQPASMTLLVQKEVAERIVAKDGKESLLSLSVKIFGEPKIERVVGKGVFKPAPKVDSAVINIKNINREKLGNLNSEKFFKLIHTGFAHKRKQLLPNLSQIQQKTSLIKIFDRLKIDKKIRGEDLTLETWVSLCKEILL